MNERPAAAPHGLPSLEIHLPISPTPMFLRQTWALVASLRRFGGTAGRSASVTAWVSPELPGLPDLNRLHPWAKPLGLHFRWVDPALFAAHWYYATALARWSAPFTADVVLMLDADVLVTAPLDALVAQVRAAPALYGLPTHISPLTEAQWCALWQASGLGEPDLCCTPLGSDFMHFTKAVRMPPYFNLGVLAAPRELMQTLGADLFDEMQRVNAFEKTVFRCQIALAMSLARYGAPWAALPLRDNFPNIEGFEQRAPQELAAVRLAHYLNKTPGLDKSRDFASRQAYADLLARPGLKGLEARAQQVLRDLGLCPLDTAMQRFRARWLAPKPQLASSEGFL